MATIKFHSFYTNPPKPVGTILDTETKFVDQSEADRVSLKYQLERYGMDSLLSQFEKTKAQFGYADTRACKNFAELQQEMANANEYFMQLPSGLRKKFNHSATEFFSEIEKNPKKMFDDGYISKDFATNLGVKFDEQINVTNSEAVVPTPVGNVETTQEASENVSAK